MTFSPNLVPQESSTPNDGKLVRGERLLPMRELEAKVGLKKTEIYERIKAGKFPPPLALGPNSVRWRESDIDGWIAALPPAQLLPRAIKK